MNQKMEELKKEYEAVPIPEELRDKVEAAIRAGEEDEKREKWRGKRSFTGSVIRVGTVAAAAALILLTLVSNSSAETAYALENIPVIGAISRVVTFRTFEDNQGNFEAKISTPKVESKDGEKKHLVKGKEDLNQAMTDYTDKIKKAYEKDMEAAGAEGREAVTTDYTVLTDNERLLSIRIDTGIVMGGSDSFTKIYHLDKTTGKQLALKDFFREDSDYLDILTADLLRQMREANEKDEAGYFIDTEYGDDFYFTKLEPEQNCYWNENGDLTLVFDKYQVSAGFMGMPELTVKRDIFDEALKEEWKSQDR